MAAELRLPVLALPGLSPDSLGDYLASLGLLRVLSRKWPTTRIAWRDEVLRVVGGPPTLDDLLDEMVRVADTQGAPDPFSREWTQYDKAWSDAQKKGTKAKSGEPLALWQAEARETQLQLFLAHAVPHARVSFNPLLGSGGNAGRRDFAAGWKQAVEMLAAARTSAKSFGKEKSEAGTGGSRVADERRSELQSLLLGRPVAWLADKLAAGSWFSQATKIYNSGQSRAREGQVCPWAMALACEGVAFFAGGASRRLGARAPGSVGAFPFVTRPMAASVENEADRIRGEMWVPLWLRPMTLVEASTLFSRGRAELGGRGAHTPARFATAILKRGVDSGVSQFRRFSLGRTTSPNTFEPRLELSFSIVSRPTATGAISTTLERVTGLIEHPGFPRDGKRFVGLRGPIEAALLDLAAKPDRCEAGIGLLDAITTALDRIDRNRSFRERRVRWEPLPLDWLQSLFASDRPRVEARLALAVVSAFPPALPFAGFRFGVQWARERNGRHAYDWATEPAWFEHAKVAPARWVWSPGQLARVLGAVLSRKLLEEATLDDAGTARPLDRAPLPASTSHVARWLRGDLDESLISAWLSRLALFDWRRVPPGLRALIDWEADSPPVDGEMALLGLMQPLIERRALISRELSRDIALEESGARTTKAARSLVALIGAGNVDAALRLAGSRYAMAGARLVSLDAPVGACEPDRLVAALLFTIPDRDRTVLFERWLRPRRRQEGGAVHV